MHNREIAIGTGKERLGNGEAVTLGDQPLIAEQCTGLGPRHGQHGLEGDLFRLDQGPYRGEERLVILAPPNLVADGLGRAKFSNVDVADAGVREVCAQALFAKVRLAAEGSLAHIYHRDDSMCAEQVKEGGNAVALIAQSEEGLHLVAPNSARISAYT